jgi:mono/diheme cytochrome c family protein
VRPVILTFLAFAFITGVRVMGQEARTVAAGVYSDEQAQRGALTYQTSCSQCHRADLGGVSGPPLTGERFNRDFAGKDLGVLYKKIATTMPRGDAGGLGEDLYLDVVAHILRENGFPSGDTELDTDGIEAIRVLPAAVKPPPPMGDFSYVDVVGCLTPRTDGTWTLTQASAPVVATPPTMTAPGSPVPPAALGSETFSLLDAMAYAPEKHKGHKVHVRGLLVKQPAEQRIAISSFDMLAPACTP